MDQQNVALWKQFGAALDMLDDALRVCPDDLWRERLWITPANAEFPPDFASFWYLGYHTIHWVDLYLFGSEEGFSPPDGFSCVELDMNGAAPEQGYSREMVRAYLSQVRQRCQAKLVHMTKEETLRPCSFPWIDSSLSYFELQLYSMRHVQEHVAQLHLFLGNHDADGDSDWVSIARSSV
ncbi:MAG: DinB family protein [Nitrolancea sp.]